MIQKNAYVLMHKDRKTAEIDETGKCRIYYKSFMPYNLYLEEKDDLDSRVNNVTNFNYWCATRILTLDRKYAKEILNSIGMAQAVTDRERAKIALSYRCASLTDVFWVKRKDERITFDEINLYENHLANTFIDIALCGRQYTVQNECLAKDLSTSGCFPKAWRRVGGHFRLLKGGGIDAVEKELLASHICRCFDVSQVLYEEDYFDGEKVAASDNITSKDYSIASIEAFEIYAANHGKDVLKYIISLDRHNYYMMNIIDYLVGNTDRHWGNWGFCVDNSNNKPVCMHKLMDFNQSFNAYDSIEGANCQTLCGGRAPQKEAAIQAVKAVGLNQLKEPGKDLFAKLPQYYDMFEERLGVLRDAEKG